MKILCSTNFLILWGVTKNPLKNSDIYFVSFILSQDQLYTKLYTQCITNMGEAFLVIMEFLFSFNRMI